MISLSRLSMLALAAALAGCGASQETEPAPKPVAWLEIGGAQGETDLSGAVPGRVQASDRSVLSFEVGGTVTRMNADIGESVGRGAVLASLDAAEYRLQVAQATATLAETDARLERARLEEKRQEALFGQQAASETRLEQARAEASSLSAIASANRAQLGIAREALSDSALRAPFSGRIARRLIEPGTQVSPGQPVYEIDGNGLEVTFSVNARQRDRLELGDTVTIVVEDAEAAQSAATISEISTRASGPGAFEVVARIAAGLPEIRSGQVVDVRLPALGGETPSDGMNRITVPLTAILPASEDRGFVWRIDGESGAIAKAPVRLGSASDNRIEIISGLARGDLIVSRGAAFLSEGQSVQRIGTSARRYAQ